MKFFNTIVLAGLSLTAVAQPTGIEANQLSENLQDRATPNTVGVLYTIVEQAYLSVHSDYNAIRILIVNFGSSNNPQTQKQLGANITTELQDIGTILTKATAAISASTATLGTQLTTSDIQNLLAAFSSAQALSADLQSSLLVIKGQIPSSTQAGLLPQLQAVGSGIQALVTALTGYSTNVKPAPGTNIGIFNTLVNQVTGLKNDLAYLLSLIALENVLKGLGLHL